MFRSISSFRLISLSRGEFRQLVLLSLLLVFSLFGSYAVKGRGEIPVQGDISAKVDINRADSVQLLKVYGIGPTLAARIIKFRGRLGGFYSVDQMGEVYGLDSIYLPTVKRSIVVDSSLIVKLDLDRCSFKELLSHPYCNYEITKWFFNSYKRGDKDCSSLSKADSLGVIKMLNYIK